MRIPTKQRRQRHLQRLQ